MKTQIQMSKWSSVVILISVCGAIGLGARSAEAARKPTFKEREALTAALPAWLRRYPIGCVWLEMSVSKNGRYAKVAPGFLNATRPPCLKYASNGYWILKRLTKWKIIYNGSTDPPCSLRVPRELAPCLR